MADWGIKVSKPGQDVKTTTDKDLLFTSKDNTLKVDTTLSTKRTTNAGGVGSITHSYGYKPMFMGFWNQWQDRWYANQGDFITFTCNTTTADVVLPGGYASKDYRMFIFKDEIT